MLKFLFIISTLFIFGCTSNRQPEPFQWNRLDYIAALEKAHKADQYHSHKAVAFDIDLSFGGKKRLEGTITLLTGSGKISIERKDGSKLIWDGEKGYIHPATAVYKGARFDLFTWPYFFEAPYKFSDEGTQWERSGVLPLREGASAETYKLTFTPGTGDSHKDWYIVYPNRETQLVDAMAYIVTFSQSVETASEEPHAITYEDYKKFDGIPIATRWRFWMWNRDRGIYQQLGEATIDNVKFVRPDETTFAVPEGSLEVPYNP